MKIEQKIFFLSVLTGLSLIPAGGFTQNRLTNQRLFDTIPFLPDHYTEKLGMFKKEPIVTNRIIFVGNSITEMARWDKLVGDSTTINRGIGGDITFGLLRRLDDITSRQPSKLFLLIGINDIGKDIPDAVIAENVRKIIERIQRESSQTKIYLESILPVNPDLQGFPQHYDKSPHIVTTNQLLQGVARDTGVEFIDSYSLFNDGSGRLKKEYALDGLHINLAGYAYWVRYLRDKGYL